MPGVRRELAQVGDRPLGQIATVLGVEEQQQQRPAPSHPGAGAVAPTRQLAQVANTWP